MVAVGSERCSALFLLARSMLAVRVGYDTCGDMDTQAALRRAAASGYTDRMGGRWAFIEPSALCSMLHGTYCSFVQLLLVLTLPVLCIRCQCLIREPRRTYPTYRVKVNM